MTGRWRKAKRPPWAAGSVVLLVGAVLAGLLSGCTEEGSGRPHIVVTTNILGDLTRNVVGDEVELTVLMKPNADPHSFGVSAAEAAEIENADLVVYNGLGLEENVLRHVAAAEEADVPTIEVGAAVHPLKFRRDDSAGQADPHFWTDPYRVREAVRLIGATVRQEVEGVDKKAIAARTTSYAAKVAKLGAWMRERFNAIPPQERKLVTNHHVFGYLAQRFDFRIVGAVVPSGTTLASPSAADLKSLSRTIERAGVRAIFVDASQPAKLAEVLKRESNVRVEVVSLYSESLTEREKGGGTYLKMMRHNTNAVAQGLQRS